MKNIWFCIYNPGQTDLKTIFEVENYKLNSFFAKLLSKYFVIYQSGYLMPELYAEIMSIIDERT